MRDKLIDFSPSEKMEMLELVGLGYFDLSKANIFLLIELFEEGLIIQIYDEFHLSHFGWIVVNSYDPILKICYNDQLVKASHGFA
jgi:predicted transcriptional regulator